MARCTAYVEQTRLLLGPVSLVRDAVCLTCGLYMLVQHPEKVM